MEKDEDEESNMEAKEPRSEKKDTAEKEGAEPMSTDENPKPESTEPEKPIWPSTTDLNTRIRKLITAFQRYFKKEELKNAQKAKVSFYSAFKIIAKTKMFFMFLQRMERKEKIDQIVRDRERQKMEVHQKRWSKKEEADFYRTISTFGVQR
jgi:chromodomain-helicase-DNA-binding protein 7